MIRHEHIERAFIVLAYATRARTAMSRRLLSDVFGAGLRGGMHMRAK
jgi:hypothetical protein